MTERSHMNVLMRSMRRISLCIALLMLLGCQSAPRNFNAIRAYYQYELPQAREALRADAYLRNDEQTVLDNARLGLAALADGDLQESERAFLTVFDLLSTAGLNEDRTTASVFVHEGVRIWKGEPFEQALMYYWISALYAVQQDWENMRAAAANGLFRLTDFGADQSADQLVRRAADDDQYLDRGYNAVDTNFALGFLMQAIGSSLSGAGGEDALFDAAIEINPSLQPLVETLRTRSYNTLLLVDYGKGPTKIAYGPDNALVRFEPQERSDRFLRIAQSSSYLPGDESQDARASSERLAADHWQIPVTANVNTMARDHRWNNLEQVRLAKSALGDGMLIGGAVVAHHGAYRQSGRTVLAGAGLILAGLLTKSGAEADTRYLEYAPHSIYIAPLAVEPNATLTIEIDGDFGSRTVLDYFQPGTFDQPRVVYLRLHGFDTRRPDWLNADLLRYGNDYAGVLVGDYPWIFGGRDVSTPTAQVLALYQEDGLLTDMTLADLLEAYAAEGILIGSGMEWRPDEPRNPSYRHILEGGRGLFTPSPDSIGYKRLMYSEHPPYQPRSELVRNIANRLRVELQEK